MSYDETPSTLLNLNDEDLSFNKSGDLTIFKQYPRSPILNKIHENTNFQKTIQNNTDQ